MALTSGEAAKTLKTLEFLMKSQGSGDDVQIILTSFSKSFPGPPSERSWGPLGDDLGGKYIDFGGSFGHLRPQEKPKRVQRRNRKQKPTNETEKGSRQQPVNLGSKGTGKHMHEEAW